MGDNLLELIYAGLERHGLAVGTDVDVVSVNLEPPLLQRRSPPPAEIDIHAGQIGRRAVRQLLWRMDHPTELAEKIVLPVELVEPGRVSEVMSAYAGQIASCPKI